MDIPTRCPTCGAPLAKRKGQYGEFLGCTNYPDCKFTFNLSGGKPQTRPQTTPDSEKIDYIYRWVKTQWVDEKFDGMEIRAKDEGEIPTVEGE